MLGFSSTADEWLILFSEVVVYALLVKIIGGLFDPTEAEKVTIFCNFLKEEGIVGIGLFEEAFEMVVILLFFDGFDHRVKCSDEI
jgi:hypothetical protein